jgi:glycosyltransferase involved in cell wall biosynthesis
MRVLSVNAFLDPVLGGGTAERTVQLARAMPRAGLDVTVLATDSGVKGSGPPALGAAQLQLVPSLGNRFFVPGITPSALRRLVNWADVVHLCNHWTLMNLVVQRTAVRLRKPYVVCPAGALPIFGRSQWLKRGYNAAGGFAVVRHAAARVAITERETEDFGMYGIDPSSVDVIPNGIEPDDFLVGDAATFRSRLGLGNHKIILFVGRLNPIKGPDLLLEAFGAVAQAFPDWTLVFVGPDGGMRDALERRTGEQHLEERVVFAGWLGGEDRVAAYRAADLVVIPSRQEAMSLIVLEAGVCGIPVLMTDRCGFDAATAVHAAVAAPPAAEALATALRGLLENNARADFGARLRELVLQEYTWDVAAARYARLFRRIASPM